MDLRQKLLKLLGAKDYVPMRRMEIISVLKFDQDATKEAHTLLDKMLEQGEIAYNFSSFRYHKQMKQMKFLR